VHSWLVMLMEIGTLAGTVILWHVCFISATISISVCENKQFVKEIIHPKNKMFIAKLVMFSKYFIVLYTKGEFFLKLFIVNKGCLAQKQRKKMPKV